MLTEAGKWVPMDASKVPLPVYLRALFQRLHIEVPVYGSLYGRVLVPYQAALKRCEWEWAWSQVSKTWSKQRSAYRRLYGGHAAPKLTSTVAARFMYSCGRRLDLVPVSLHGAYDVEQTPTDGLPVCGTFIHLLERRTL